MNVSEHAPDCQEMVTDRKIPCQDQGEKRQVNPSMNSPRVSSIRWSPQRLVRHLLHTNTVGCWEH